MEPIDGGKGKVYICPKNFVYNKDKELNGSMYFRCKLRQICSARVVVTGKKLSFRGLHKHEVDHEFVQDLRFKSSLIWRSRAEAKTLSKIFEEEKVKYKQAASKLPHGFESVKSSMLRARKIVMPGVPHSLQDIADFLQKPKYSKYTQELGPLGRNFFYTYLVSAPALFFVSPTARQVIEVVGKAQLQMDATYKISPREGEVYHLFTVNVVIENYVYPLMFVLMDKRTLDQYLIALNEVRKICGSVKVVSILADYDGLLRSAVKQVFPNTKLLGCWFHYAKSVYILAREVGLAEDAVAVRMAMAIPLLPHHVIEKAIDFVCSLIENEDFESLMERQWLHSNISVYYWDQRTNGSVESYNNQLLRYVNRSLPNFWVLIDCIQRLESTKSTKLVRASSGLEVVKKHTKAYQTLMEKISACQSRFDEDQNVETFLRNMSTSLVGLQGNLHINREALLMDESDMMPPNDLLQLQPNVSDDILTPKGEPESKDEEADEIFMDESPENDVEIVLVQDECQEISDHDDSDLITILEKD